MDDSSFIYEIFWCEPQSLLCQINTILGPFLFMFQSLGSILFMFPSLLEKKQPFPGAPSVPLACRTACRWGSCPWARGGAASSPSPASRALPCSPGLSCSCNIHQQWWNSVKLCYDHGNGEREESRGRNWAKREEASCGDAENLYLAETVLALNKCSDRPES